MAARRRDKTGSQLGLYLREFARLLIWKENHLYVLAFREFAKDLPDEGLKAPTVVNPIGSVCGEFA